MLYSIPTVLISAALIGTSTNAKALDLALMNGQIVLSDAAFSEFTEVLYRPKFDRYLSNERRTSLLERIEQDAMHFKVKKVIDACRDPKDNKFLELAVTAHAFALLLEIKIYLYSIHSLVFPF